MQITIKCECGNELVIKGNSTDGPKVENELMSIDAYAIVCGGETEIMIECKCGNIVTVGDL